MLVKQERLKNTQLLCVRDELDATQQKYNDLKQTLLNSENENVSMAKLNHQMKLSISEHASKITKMNKTIVDLSSLCQQYETSLHKKQSEIKDQDKIIQLLKEHQQIDQVNHEILESHKECDESININNVSLHKEENIAKSVVI